MNVHTRPYVTLIAAVAENGAIGYRNNLIYRLSADLKRFKALTTGHTVVMGSNTFRSLPKGALPNRRNIVLSRRVDARFEGCDTFHSLPEALAACGAGEQVFVIGGASVYREALPLADRLALTEVHDTPERADVFFPEVNVGEWREVGREHHEADERNERPFCFVDYVRR